MSAVRRDRGPLPDYDEFVRRRRLAQEFGDEPLFLPLYRRGGRKRAYASSARYQTPGIHLLRTRAAYPA